MVIAGLDARRIAATALAQVVDERTSLDSLLDAEHGMARLRALDPRDRSLVRAIATTALRHRGPIEAALAIVLDRPVPRNARHLTHLLHVAAAQILYMDVPASAAVNLAVTEAGADPRSKRFKGLVNAVLRKLATDPDAMRERVSAKHRDRVPAWLFKAMRRDFGRERALASLAAQAVEPAIDLSLQGDGERPEGAMLANGSWRTLAGGAVPDWPGFEAGHWWVQDAAAAIPVHLLGDVTGCTVLDACAAPGGKTAQFAARDAKVSALEASPTRLARLVGNLERLNLEAETIEGDALAFHTAHTERRFDAVLVDAPCSSTGTMRRHPDVAWTKTPDDIAALAALQRDLVLALAPAVAEGGRLVFSNCSLLKQEGEDIFAALTEPMAALGFSPDPVTPDEVWGCGELLTGQGTVRTLPFHTLPFRDAAPSDDPRWSGMDGFFCARWRRDGGSG